MPLAPIDTQRWIPWPEPISITSVRPNSTDVTETYASAGVYRLGAIEATPSKGAYVRADIKITIATDGVGFTPKPRDTVLWNGDTYTVLSVDGSDWQKFWILTARNLALAADLRQVGVLSRSTVTQDEAMRPARSAFAAVTSDIPCRVQPLGWSAIDVMEKRTGPQRFIAVVGKALGARAGDRFSVGADHYTVVASSNPERIDELQTLTLEALLP